MKPVSLVLCLLAAASGCAFVSAEVDATSSGALARSTQIIVVTTSGWSAVEGQLQRYERANTHENWRSIGGPIPIVVGKNGMGWGIGVTPADDPGVRAPGEPVKKEGDGKAPAGIFALGTAFGYASQPLPGSRLPYLELTPSIECVDDVDSKYYNRIVDRSAVTPDWNSSEHMRNTGESYRWGIVVDHNGIDAAGDRHEPMPGGGSCIFLHIWHSRDQGTVGCTAMSIVDVETLLTWLDPGRKPMLVQLPEPDYARLVPRWKLPELPNDSSATARLH
jgi:L,D-peptidoglycan transpeptidase YkuD (ErfK/YbiS/YcfS/YnhG family)